MRYYTVLYCTLCCIVCTTLDFAVLYTVLYKCTVMYRYYTILIPRRILPPTAVANQRIVLAALYREPGYIGQHGETNGVWGEGVVAARTEGVITVMLGQAGSALVKLGQSGSDCHALSA